MSFCYEEIVSREDGRRVLLKLLRAFGKPVHPAAIIRHAWRLVGPDDVVPELWVLHREGLVEVTRDWKFKLPDSSDLIGDVESRIRDLVGMIEELEAERDRLLLLP